MLTAVSSHMGSQIAEKLFGRGPWALIDAQKQLLKPLRTFQKLQKMKNISFNSTAVFTSEIVMVRTLADPKGPPRAQKKVDALFWRAPWTHKARKTPLRETMPIGFVWAYVKNNMFENHRKTTQICVSGEYALSMGSSN